MEHFTEKYINPFTDYGFKKLFGEELNKDLLLDFLNELLKDEQGKIQSITYIKNEQLGDTVVDRKAIFDLYCENERGEKFIVELQKAKQNFFKDRTVFYSTFPIREQAQQGNWNFKLNAVYTVAILDFVFEEDEKEPEKYRYNVKLTDTETHKIFYDKLTFVYLEMPKFNKTLDQLTTRFDKWLYILRNLTEIQEIPEPLQGETFEKLFEVAEIAKFNPAQVRFYEESLKYYRDLQNTIDTAWDEGVEAGIEIGKEQGKEIGKEEGIAIGEERGIAIGEQRGLEIGEEQGRLKEREQIAINLLRAGLSDEQVVAATGLTLVQVAGLRS